jgi:hypothetical protein
VFAAVCVLLAALGHVMMSAGDLPLWAPAAGVVVTGAVGWCLAGRERGLPLIVAVVVAAQAVLHSAFSLAQSAAAEPASGSAAPVGMGSWGHDTGSMASMASMTSMGSMDMGSMDMGSMSMDSLNMGHIGHMWHMGMGNMAMGNSSGGTSSFGMLAAHLLAALLCGLWLAYGERAAFRILRAVAGWLAAPLRLLFALPVTPDRPSIRGRRRHSDRAPRLLPLVHAITSRGPPVGTAVI